jgi:hypothetical protein
MKSPRNRPAARWPFWLLLAAWFCANSPQAATHGVIVWLANARHFSHQQRLSAKVASILAGTEIPATLVAASPAPERPFTAPAPAEAGLKKIDLFVVITSVGISPAEQADVWADTARMPPPTPWREHPVEPPRAA